MRAVVSGYGVFKEGQGIAAALGAEIDSLFRVNDAAEHYG